MNIGTVLLHPVAESTFDIAAMSSRIAEQGFSSVTELEVNLDAGEVPAVSRALEVVSDFPAESELVVVGVGDAASTALLAASQRTGVLAVVVDGASDGNAGVSWPKEVLRFDLSEGLASGVTLVDIVDHTTSILNRFGIERDLQRSLPVVFGGLTLSPVESDDLELAFESQSGQFRLTVSPGSDALGVVRAFEYIPSGGTESPFKLRTQHESVASATSVLRGVLLATLATIGPKPSEATSGQFLEALTRNWASIR